MIQAGLKPYREEDGVYTSSSYYSLTVKGGGCEVSCVRALEHVV